MNDAYASINSREISTVCLSGITQIQYTLISTTSQYCGDENITLMPQLQYQRANSTQSWISLNPSKFIDIHHN